MQHIILNTCPGGFDLPPEVMQLYGELAGIRLYPYVEASDGTAKPYDPVVHRVERVHFFVEELPEGSYIDSYVNDNYVDDSCLPPWRIERDDPALVEAVRRLNPLGLKIVEVPGGLGWTIDSCEGVEWIANLHLV